MLACGVFACAPATMPTTSLRDVPAKQETSPTADGNLSVEPPRPPSLFSWITIARPARDLPVLAHLAPEDSAFSMLATPEVATQNVVGSELLAAEVDLERPVVMGFAGSRLCVAFGIHAETRLRSRAQAEFDLVNDESDGSVAIRPRDGSAGRCRLFRARGSRRLVCGSDDSAVRDYGEFLSRAAETLPDNVALRITLAHPQRRALPPPRADPMDSAGEVGMHAAMSFFRDQERTNLDVSIAGSTLDVELDQAFRGATSPITAVLLAGDKDQALPDPFWRLPADTDLAFFTARADGSRLRALIEPSFDRLNEGATESRAVFQAVSTAFLTGAPAIFAFGWDRAAIVRELARDVRGPSARKALAGWTLIHVDKPFRTLAVEMEDLLRADVAETAAVIRHGRNKLPTRLSTKDLPKSDELPASVRHLVYAHLPPKRAGTAPKGSNVEESEDLTNVPHEVHVFLGEDGTGTWIVTAHDELVARARLKQVLSAGTESSIATVPELARLRRERGVVLGFTNLAAIVVASGSGKTEAKSKRMQTELGWLAALPNHAETRVPFRVTTQAPARSLGSGLIGTRGTLSLPAAALSDLAGLTRMWRSRE
jgi:hypothetical protein